MKQCPDCNRTMRTVRERDGDDAWRCDYCDSFWRSVCDKCLSRECWAGNLMCEKARTAGITTKKEGQ